VTVLLLTGMQPPPSFLVTMEEYIREAPRANIESKSLENEENQPSDNEEAAPQETEKLVEEVKQVPAEPEEEPQLAAEPAEEAVDPQPPTITGDLLVFPLCPLNNVLFSSVSVSKPHVLATILLAELG